MLRSFVSSAKSTVPVESAWVMSSMPFPSMAAEFDEILDAAGSTGSR